MNDNTPNSIPDWDAEGIIPPRDHECPASQERSPYRASLINLVRRFGNTDNRRTLLSGLLDFRAELHKAGLTRGFQWIDGSFVEDVENRKECPHPPKDIDVVTFFYIPDGQTQASLYGEFPVLFDSFAAKERYGVDAYPVPLNQTVPENLVENVTYWYSLWSQSRSEVEWKGYVQVDLDASQDAGARAELGRMINEEGGQP